ncbi:MAG TPA: hypothetical protein VHF22_10240, partial [Planctomycetota bacterium]|nr:hypothetical protein [Planctomycetota bacterium]
TAIVLGPRDETETAVLVLGARLEPGPAAPPSSALDAGATRFTVLDAGSILLRAPDQEYDFSADALLDLLKGATGGDAAWPSDDTSVEGYRGHILMTNTPALLSASAQLIDTLAARSRPRRVDAWLLRASAAPPADGPIDDDAAQALLARALRRDGLSLAARFGGGVPPGSRADFRARTRQSFLSGVEDVSGGLLPTSTAFALLHVPQVGVAEAGTWLEVSLEPAGPDAAGGLALRARLAAQAAELRRAAVLPCGSEPLEVRLPSFTRRGIEGRATLPARGGFAVFTSEATAGDGPAGEHLVLLVRAAP